MDLHHARTTLNIRLDSLAAQRRQAQKELDRTALEMGATATYLREVLGQSKAQSAQRLGVSPSHLTEYMTRAQDAGTQIDDPLHRVASTRTAGDLEGFFERHGPVSRIVSSFESSDTLYMSGLHPMQFLQRSSLDGDREWLDLSHLMFQAEDGDWIMVSAGVANVGYGGTGPSNVQRLLKQLGLEDDLAYSIAYSRVSDVSFDGLNVTLADHSDHWPRYSVPAPAVRRGQLVSGVSVDGLLNAPPQPRDTAGGFSPAETGNTRYQNWLSLLDGAAPYPTPAWMLGPRRGRLYLDSDAAREDGFEMGRGRGVASFILQQGDLQLWVETPYRLERDSRIAPEVYPILRESGFYTDRLEAHDQRGAFRRWLLTRLTGPDAPYVDLAPAGNHR